MARKKWVTDEQEKWLSQHIPEFVKAQQQRSTKEFFAPIYRGWFEKFPCPKPTELEVEEAGNNVEKAKAAITTKAKEVSAK